MKELYEYLYKRVSIVTTDEETYVGEVDMYWSADDDDYGEGIGICLNKEPDYGIALYEYEIKSIEEI